MSISLQFLERSAADSGFQPAALEKVTRLGELAADIGQNAWSRAGDPDAHAGARAGRRCDAVMASEFPGAVWWTFDCRGIHAGAEKKNV